MSQQYKHCFDFKLTGGAFTLLKFALFLIVFSIFTTSVFAGDNYIITESNRRVLVRLEFEADRVRPVAASIAALNEIAPMFTDGVMRRYEIHGNFCAEVEGSRRNAVANTESVFESLIRRGVSARNITSTMNVANTGRDGVCNDERRVDIVSIDIHRERRRRPAPPLPIAAEGRRTVAVYMAGEEPRAVRGVHNILGGELVRVISANENFLAVDRTDFILEQLERELEYQYSGMVDDEQIQALGRQLGVELMCIANIVPVGNGYYIDTRLVDIVTAENVRTVTATSTLRDAAEKMRVARDIAHELVDPGRANRCGHGAETVYDPAHQFCFGGRAYNFCGGSGYNPQTQGCIAGREVGTLCSDGSVVALGTHCGQHILSVAVAPPTGGSVIRAPDAQTYRADETVTLSAMANRGFTFAGWAGAQTSNASAINVTMTRNMPVIAMFRPENNNALITTAFPSNGGWITRVPESNVYQSGELVRVTATPNRGFEFVGWEGAASEKSPTINIMMNEGKALVAIFRPNLHTLNATAQPEIGGSVFINGTAIAEATTTEFGNIVEAFALPAQGYVFTGWSGGATGRANPVFIDLTDANVNIIANFAPQVTDNETRIIAVSSSATAIETSPYVAQTDAAWQNEQSAFPLSAQHVTQQEAQPGMRLVRPTDHFIAPKWMPPITKYTQAGWGFNLEYGQIRGDASPWFWSIDAGLSVKDDGYDYYREGTYNYSITAGLTFNLGLMREFSNNTQHIAYGGSVGLWGAGWHEEVRYAGSNSWSMEYHDTWDDRIGFIGPFVRYRWHNVEVLYRALMGYGEEYEYRSGGSYDNNRDSGFRFINQVMLGLNISTNRRSYLDYVERQVVDHFFAPKWMPPITKYTQAGWGFNLEYGQIRGIARPWFWSIDFGGSVKTDDYDWDREGTYNHSVTVGGTFNLGLMREFANKTQHIAYGGSVGLWGAGWDEKVRYAGSNSWSMEYHDTWEFRVGFIGPFVRYRWNNVEVLYRALMGWGEESEYRSGNYYDDNYDSGLRFINQFMLGFNFSTKRRAANSSNW